MKITDQEAALKYVAMADKARANGILFKISFSQFKKHLDTAELTEEERLLRGYASKVTSSFDRGVPFDLTFLQYRKLKAISKCHYTGIDMQPKGPYQFTLDRIDSTKGYTKNNTVPCCKFFNSLKGNLEGHPSINFEDMRQALVKLIETTEHL
jgi:hypothetical protein